MITFSVLSFIIYSIPTVLIVSSVVTLIALVMSVRTTRYLLDESKQLKGRRQADRDLRKLELVKVRRERLKNDLSSLASDLDTVSKMVDNQRARNGYEGMNKDILVIRNGIKGISKFVGGDKKSSDAKVASKSIKNETAAAEAKGKVLESKKDKVVNQ